MTEPEAYNNRPTRFFSPYFFFFFSFILLHHCTRVSHRNAFCLTVAAMTISFKNYGWTEFSETVKLLVRSKAVPMRFPGRQYCFLFGALLGKLFSFRWNRSGMSAVLMLRLFALLRCWCVARKNRSSHSTFIHTFTYSESGYKTKAKI